MDTKLLEERMKQVRKVKQGCQALADEMKQEHFHSQLMAKLEVLKK